MSGKKYQNVHGAYRRHFPAWLRRAVFTRDDHGCVYCGRTIYDTPDLVLHVDHIFPWVLGGAEFDLDNLATACAACNWSFGGRRKPGVIERVTLAIVATRNRARLPAHTA